LDARPRLRTFSAPNLSGFIAWVVVGVYPFMYRSIFQAEFCVFIQWAIQNLTFSRGAEVSPVPLPRISNFSKELSEINPDR